MTPALAAFIRSPVATPPRVGYTVWKPKHKDEECPW
jgi:hypothetical protein